MHKAGGTMRAHFQPAAATHRMLNTHRLTAVFGIDHIATQAGLGTDISRMHIDEPDIALVFAPVFAPLAAIIVVATFPVIATAVFAVIITPALAITLVAVSAVIIIVAVPAVSARKLDRCFRDIRLFSTVSRQYSSLIVTGTRDVGE
jgi:hypothetical protein